MFIRIMYKNGNYDLVKDILLDQLIGSSKVLKFYRSGRWVTVGKDPVRGMGEIDDGHRRRRYDHSQGMSGSA